MKWDVEAVRKAASADRKDLVAHHSAESSARQSREDVLNTRIDRTAWALEGRVMRAEGFMSDFHARTQEASGDINSLINESIYQGLMDLAYQEARLKATLPAPIPIIRSIPKRTDRGGSTRRGITLSIRTDNILRGSSSETHSQPGGQAGGASGDPPRVAPGVLLVAGRPHEGAYRGP